MKRLLALLCLALAACGSDPVKEDPCPHGICTSQSSGTSSGAGGSSAQGSTGTGPSSSATGGGCTPAWTCTPWQDQGGGMYTRTCKDDNQCPGAVGKPAEGPIALPALDLDYYKCKVEPILDKSCSMMGCHGMVKGRAFHMFARGRKRNAEMVPQVQSCPVGPQVVDLDAKGSGTVMCIGWSKHTASEWQQNYDNARALYVGLNDPAQSDLLAQPTIGGKAHAGVHFFTKGDAEYQTIFDWLSGQKLGSACDPGAN